MANPLARPPIELTGLGVGLSSQPPDQRRTHDLPRIVVPGSQAASVAGHVLASMERLKGRRGERRD
jgi:hypothetical protein